jgi:disintegrin and metalloproteinase domain-containing protein 10
MKLFFFPLKILHTDDGKESKRQLDTSHIYEGKVLGDKDSYVHGSISDGVFHGRIITSKDSYFVEKAHFYFPNHSREADGFHSVIYKDQHVDDPYKEKRTVHANGCGLTDDVMHWMDRVQSGAEEEIEVVPLDEDKNVNKTHYQHENNRIYEDSPSSKYSEEANTRSKRAAASPRFQERNTCSLYIQTDPLIWRHIRESIPDVSSTTKTLFVSF